MGSYTSGPATAWARTHDKGGGEVGMTYPEKPSSQINQATLPQRSPFSSQCSPKLCLFVLELCGFIESWFYRGSQAKSQILTSRLLGWQQTMKTSDPHKCGRGSRESAFPPFRNIPQILKSSEGVPYVYVYMHIHSIYI